MSKNKIIRYCNKLIEISLCGIVFYIPISTSFIEIFASLAIVAWLTKKIITKTRFKDILHPNFLRPPILFYLLVCLAATIFSSNQVISFRHLITKTSEYLLLFFIVVEILDKRILRNILIVMVISVGLIGIDGIFQYFTNYDFFRLRTPVIGVRINGPFTTPNDFSNYIVTLLPLVASLSFLRFKKIWIRPTLIINSLILFICLVLSVTRSSWIALLLAIPLVAILGNKRLFLIILLVITITLSFFPLLSGLAKSRIIYFFDYNEAQPVAERQLLWKLGLNMFLDRPILGQGLGTFMYNFDRFKPEEYPFNWGISYAHNCFLQIASETGILGLSTFSSIIIILFLFSFELLRKIKENHFYYYILSGCLLGIFAYLVTSFFDTNLYSLPLAVLFWFMMGLTVGVIKIIRAEVI